MTDENTQPDEDPIVDPFEPQRPDETRDEYLQRKELADVLGKMDSPRG